MDRRPHIIDILDTQEGFCVEYVLDDDSEAEYRTTYFDNDGNLLVNSGRAFSEGEEFKYERRHEEVGKISSEEGEYLISTYILKDGFNAKRVITSSLMIDEESRPKVLYESNWFKDIVLSKMDT